ncbi:LysR substrate-binding domain-containing protein [Microbacterium sp. NPDC090007]|uniref:LysR substrate-binding domain-containing protein n=1 Tax=Microbacterium sp. NPDC090007 TaxID=3364204 RepID=UPI00381B223F
MLGAVPGATPGKWIGLWRERMPQVALDLREIAAATQRDALETVDAALVRLPIAASDDLHIIPLYDEQPVVVMSTDADLTVADELDLADLARQVVITPLDDVLGLTVPDAVTPTFGAPVDTGEAIATVAAGVGIVVVPMSLARAHQRRDVEYRVLRDGPVSTVALAWRREHTTPDVESFVGIVRGRTARSSR